MNILVVEDERKVAALLRTGLEDEGHSVGVAHTGPEGLALAKTAAWDTILLDVMLPGFDGFELLRQMRKAGLRAPVLMLTARDSTTDVVTGLNAGADDYLKKPFSFQELLARLVALARRGPATHSVELTVGDLRLDTGTHEVFRSGKPIQLTRKEYQLLEFLMRANGRVVSRSSIIQAVWGNSSEASDNTVEAIIKLLRKKIEDDHSRKLIQTVRGFGYRLVKSR
ncbi:MAG TPA: response regulator transcription factor [Terriglobales bacterium]